MATLRLLTDKEIRKLFGEFKYKDKLDGRIIIEKKWFYENTCVSKVPLLGKIRCHHFVKEQLIKIFAEIKERKLSHLIDVFDTLRRGGCFYPRHINWDIYKPLSRHTWGIAIDINPSTNLPGTKGTINSEIVEIFERNGFIWGGGWQIPDPMHFEFVKFLNS